MLPQIEGNILPVGKTNDIKKVTELLAGDIPYVVDEIKKFSWDALEAVAYLNGITIDLTKGMKEEAAVRLAAMHDLDVAFQNLTPTHIKSLKQGLGVEFLDKSLFTEIYGRWYGLTPEELELEGIGFIVKRLAAKWEQVAQERLLRRARFNYVQHIGEALLRPDTKLSDEVLLSALDVERAMGKKYRQGFSLEFIEPWRLPAAYEVFNKLDMRPVDLIGFERFHDEGWESIARDGARDLHYTTTAASERIQQLANNVNEVGGYADNRARYGIMRHIGEGVPVYEVVRKTLPEGIQPWQLTFEDFLVWYRGNGVNILDDLGENAPLLTELAKRDLTVPWVTRGMNEAQKAVYDYARKKRYDVLKKAALVDGYNVPEIFLREFGDDIIGQQKRAQHAILQTLPEVSIGRRWGKPQQAAKWRDLAQFYEILKWNIDNVIQVATEKHGGNLYQQQLLDITVLKDGYKIPEYAELLLNLDAVRINAEFDLNVLIETRKAINTVRGTRGIKWNKRKVSHFQSYANEAKGVGATEIAEQWENLDRYTRELLTVLDDKIFSMDGHVYDNSELLTRAG